MTRVAWIGLRAMGARMAGRLLDAGHDLSVWNRTPRRADDLSAAGARRAASPSDAVRGAENAGLGSQDYTATSAVSWRPARGRRPHAVPDQQEEPLHLIGVGARQRDPVGQREQI